MSNTRLRFAINTAFTALVVAFCAVYASRLDWASLAGLRVAPGYMLLSIAAGVVYLMLSAFIWVRMLYRLNDRVRPTWELFAVYAKSWMGRYIPGKVTWIAGKIHFASRLGIPVSQLGVTSLLEAGVQMATQLAISLAIVLIDGNFSSLPTGIRLVTLAATGGLIISLLPPVFNAVVGLFLRLTKKTPRNNVRVGYAAIGEMTALYSFGYLLLGITYFLTLRSFIPGLGLSLFAFTTAGISIAGTMGILALFAPSGLGVREGFIVLFLSIALPVELAALSAVVLRLTALLMDFSFLGVCALGNALAKIRRARA